MILRIVTLICLLVLVPINPALASVTCTGDTQWLSSTTLPVSGVPFTISVWVKSSARAANDTMVWIGDTAQATHWYTVRLNNTNANRASVWHRDGDSNGRAEQSTDTISDATWHHVLGRFVTDASRAVSVDDANEAVDLDSQSAITPDNISICRSSDSSPGAYWDGQIAEVAIWDVNLAAGDRTALAGGANPLAVDATNLIAYWPLLTDATDAKGSNDLTNNGTATFDDEDHPTIDAPPGAEKAKVQTIIVE